MVKKLNQSKIEFIKKESIPDYKLIIIDEISMVEEEK